MSFLKALIVLLFFVEVAVTLGFGLGGGGGCCCGGCGGGCGGGFGRKKRSIDEWDNQSEKGPSCNNEHLRQIMKENMANNTTVSENRISQALEEESSSFAVMCSNETIAFKASSHIIHCTLIGSEHQCLAFSL